MPRASQGRVVFVGIALVYLLIIIQRAFFSNLTDFDIFYTASQHFLHHQSIYLPVDWGAFPHIRALPPILQQHFVLSPNLNPPGFSLLTMWLSLLPFSVAYILWVGLLLLCGWWSVRLVGEQKEFYPLSPMLLAAAFFLAYPVVRGIAIGQLGVALMLVLLFALRAFQREQWKKAAVILGVLAGFKLFCGMFVFIFLFRREWRALQLFVLSFVLTFSLPVFIFGVKVYQEYFYILQHIYWYASTNNASLYGFLTRVFGGSTVKPLIDAVGPAVLAYGVAIALGVYWIYRTIRQYPENILPPFLLTIVLMLWLSPLAWLYYCPILLIVFLYVLPRYPRFKFSLGTFFYGRAYLASVLLLNLPFTLNLPLGEVPASFVFGKNSCYFYGLTGLLVLLLSSFNVKEEDYMLPNSLRPTIIGTLYFSLTGLYSLSLILTHLIFFAKVIYA
ncbi:MAG: hypothetical protein DHS20C10_14080 [marine bacterium B5-7]|nr:MAG: hypothetical protein DHS20C10_14080 [marine bacterium B5-7]